MPLAVPPRVRAQSAGRSGAGAGTASGAASGAGGSALISAWHETKWQVEAAVMVVTIIAIVVSATWYDGDEKWISWRPIEI